MLLEIYLNIFLSTLLLPSPYQLLLRLFLLLCSSLLFSDVATVSSFHHFFLLYFMLDKGFYE